MVDPLTLDRWIYRALYVAMAGLVVFVQVLPLETRTGILPGPEWMLCLTFAWLQRRPDYLPPWMIALTFVVLDMLLMRPPGLMTAMALMGAEFLRARLHVSVETAFAPEWILTAVTIVGVFLGHWAVLALFGVPEAGFGLFAVQAVMTVLAYPLVVAVSRYVLGVRRVTPGELDPRGLTR